MERRQEQLAKRKYDLILLDITADADGFDLKRALQVLSQNADGTKTIVLTDLRETAEDLQGYANVCVKPPPANDEDLAALVESFLPLQHAHHEDEQNYAGVDRQRAIWPSTGELQNVIQAAVVVSEGKELKPEFLPTRIRELEMATDPTWSFRVGTSLDAVE